MMLDWIVLFSIWAVTLLLLIIYTPRKKIREAHVVFLFKQVMTWFLGLLVVELGWIEYPVRLFQAATQSSFTFEYFVYPAVCVLFNLRFPEHKSRWRKVVWFLFFPTWMTILESLIEQHTNLVHYIHWTWYWTWISLFIVFYISRKYYLWFFRKEKDIVK